MPPVTCFGPDFPFAYDAWLAAPQGLARIPADRHGTRVAIIGAGAASGGVMDASNLLKPLLSSGKLRCIGSTTFHEYRGIFDKDKALSRRFQKIDVMEPSTDDAYLILKGLKSRFEEHHGLRYTNKALRLALTYRRAISPIASCRTRPST